MFRLPLHARRLMQDRRGVSALLTAVLTPVLIGFLGLAIDAASWQIATNNLQGAADMAAWAAEMEYNATSSASYARTQAKGIAASMGFVDGSGGVTVTLNIPPQSGSHTSNSTAAEVIITQTQTRYLAGLVWANAAPTASGRAVVGSSTTTSTICMSSLDGSDPNTLYVGGTNNTVNLSGCSYYNNSTYNNGGVTGIGITGSGDTFTAKSMTLAGPAPTPRGTANSFCASPCTVSANVSPSGSNPNDPYATQTIPAPGSCATYPAGKLITKTSFTGGATFCGGFLLSGATVNFSNGVYVFDGSSLSGSNATITVSNATLVFTGTSALGYGSLTLSGASSLTMTAPTSASGYSTTGISLWFDTSAGTTKGLTVSAAATISMSGAVYAPGSVVRIDGTATSSCTNIVAYKITMDGTNDSLTYDSASCSNPTQTGSGGGSGGSASVGFLE